MKLCPATVYLPAGSSNEQKKGAGITRPPKVLKASPLEFGNNTRIVEAAARIVD